MLEAVSDSVHLILRSCQLHSRFHSSHNCEKPANLLAVAEGLGEHPRRPHLRLSAGESPVFDEEIEISGSYPNDNLWLTIELDGLSDNARVLAEALLPEPIIEYHNVVFA